MARTIITTQTSEDVSYTDEFGRISGEVKNVLDDLLPKARRFALSKLQDELEGDRLLHKAAANVDRVFCEEPDKIDNLKGYLFTAFKHLVLAELEKRKRFEPLDANSITAPEPDQCNAADAVEQKILIDEIMLRMDPLMRKTFELLVLGHSFEAIAKGLGMKSNHLRSMYSKQLEKLSRQINEEPPKTVKKGEKGKQKSRLWPF